MNFSETSYRYRVFAQELPRFISEVRRMFTPEEIATQRARVEREQNEKDKDVLDEDDPLRDTPLRSRSAFGSSRRSRNY
jgi:hypothetical protein